MYEQELYHHPPALLPVPLTAQFPDHLSLSLSLVVNFIPLSGCPESNGSVVIPVNPDMLDIDYWLVPQRSFYRTNMI